MTTGTLGEALEQEHREIDAGLEAFGEGITLGEVRAGQLTAAMDALRRHIYLEEEMLFPPLRQAGMVAPVFVMLKEHGELWRALDVLEAEVATNGASASAADVLRELAEGLESHNMKEEQILYPRADGVLTAEAGSELAAFLESGRMPAGWVCEGARR